MASGGKGMERGRVCLLQGGRAFIDGKEVPHDGK